VTLEDDVVERVRAESKARGTSFKETLNELVREGLVLRQKLEVRPRFKVKATPVGLRPGLSYDDVEALLTALEGEDHR
jgi:DNA-binding HxlR family transcriptional regulator